MFQKFAAQVDLRKAAVLALVVGLAACGGGTTTTDAAEGAEEKIFESNVSLTGAGASFPAPLYQNWFVELNKKVPELQVNYQSVGSGAGVEQFTAKTVNFGASDVAMTDEEIAAIDEGAILLPMVAGAIVMAYNLPGVEELNLPRDVYTNILLGNITSWNDPAIVEVNPDVELPDADITVVTRSDGSGTTGVFTKHLSAISPDFESQIGEGKTVDWPTTGNFITGKGNEGVTAQIQQAEGAIGYVEYGYATNNGLAVAALENASGNFVTPTGKSASATLDAVELPENLRAFITDPEGGNSYPVVTYTWMLIYESYEDPMQAKGVEVMVEYGLNEGQAISLHLGYVALPDRVREKVAAAADGLSPDYTITLE
ncbi:MAG: phosphate ABC transporter substrate-binding protein PstS [Leptolyngbya sp. SIOISBB]|nr:phosphate ABC transporter substrate-binding protein PstS [Leptolyngbya sp. SIOISBB]